MGEWRPPHTRNGNNRLRTVCFNYCIWGVRSWAAQFFVSRSFANFRRLSWAGTSWGAREGVGLAVVGCTKGWVDSWGKDRFVWEGWEASCGL